MHTCGDLFTDCLLENDIDDEIDSLSPDSFDSPSFYTHAPNAMLELKPLQDSLMYVFLGHNGTFSIIVA